jgi:acetoin utilization deacetylase AcuC-like enzyme
MNSLSSIKTAVPGPPPVPVGHPQTSCTKRTSSSSSKKIQVSILHSSSYTQIIHQNMKYIHNDRDILVSNLLYYCGFIKQRPSFFHVVKPCTATRVELESFHTCDYLDLIQYCNTTTTTHSQGDIHMQSILERYGLIDDCPLPTVRSTSSVYNNPQNDCYNDNGDNNESNYNLYSNSIQSNYDNPLWTYCLSITGASIHAMNLLVQNKSDVAINWGGGRHHAHPSKASGFCYVNDIVLAIQNVLTMDLNYSHNNSSNSHNKKDKCEEENKTTQRTTTTKRKVLYLDLDIHHSDGVQAAFYNTDQVLTISLHRYTPGFFPCTSGSINEKGKYKTNGVGYNLNIPMPRFCNNIDFVCMIQRVLKYILPEYDPDIVVVCVGADGLRGDDLVKETFEGWDLTPEGLAECVRLIALECAGENIVEQIEESSVNHNEHQHSSATVKNNKRRRKLLILGGGGYNASNTARTFLLCTAAACEGARPGMISELPQYIPQHEYLSRYGPSFQLYSQRHFDEVRCGVDDDIGRSSHCVLSAKSRKTNREDEYSLTLKKGIEAIHLTHSFLKNRRDCDSEGSSKNMQDFCSLDNLENCWSNSTCTVGDSGFVKNNDNRYRSRKRKKYCVIDKCK